MIGPSGFMQAPQTTRRTAWCVACDGPVEVNDGGCIACAIIRVQHAKDSAKRRAQLHASGKCINGARHAAPEPGKTKCTRCLEVHRASAKRAT